MGDRHDCLAWHERYIASSAWLLASFHSCMLAACHESIAASLQLQSLPFPPSAIATDLNIGQPQFQTSLRQLAGMSDGERIWKLWQHVRKHKPLIQCITNYVSTVCAPELAGHSLAQRGVDKWMCWQDIMANVLLAAGASPAMVHSAAEVEDFSPLTSALLINVGTLTPDWVEGMTLAGAVACMHAMCSCDSIMNLRSVHVQPRLRRNMASLGCSIPLPPAQLPTELRHDHHNAIDVMLPCSRCADRGWSSQAISKLVKLQPAVIRGNASEIMAVAGSGTLTRGVDSTAAVTDAASSAQQLALGASCVVAVSGATDLVQACSGSMSTLCCL